MRSRRAQLRRVQPIFSLVMLAILATAPVVLATGLPAADAISDICLHLLRLCFAALVGFDGVLHRIPLFLLGAGIAYAGARRLRLVRRGSAVLGRLRTRSPRPGEHLHQLAVRHRALAATRIVLGSATNPAFTAGILRPQLFLAEQLVRDLSDAELEAVFLHELHHLHRRDPLKGMMAGILADILFWIPLVRNATGGIQARMEFAADDAARPLGNLVVAGAILEVAGLSHDYVPGARSFTAPDLLERRIERLLGAPAADRLQATTPRAFATSMATLTLVWLLAVASTGSHAAHEGAEDYCPHHHVHGILHADTDRLSPGNYRGSVWREGTGT